MSYFPIASNPHGLLNSDDNTRGTLQMDQILSPTSNLPLNQLSPICSKLLKSINDNNVSQKALISLETNLWREVKRLKTYRHKSNIFTYLIGFYHTILFQLVRVKDSDDIFQYHILIRLGDLNRYLDRTDSAEYYYCNARNLFPHYGHAYNQLGLLTKVDNIYKRCYYYARAAKSSKKPLDKNLAESNLRIVIIDHEDSILNYISNDDPSMNTRLDGNSNTDKSLTRSNLPESAFDWFYVIVIAIYFDNILPVARPFMRFLGENLSTLKATVPRDGIKTTTISCDRDSYLLLASLDILLDWCKIGKQGKAVCVKIGNELRQMRSSLSAIMSSLKKSSNIEVELDKYLPCSSQTLSQTSGESAKSDVTTQSPSSMNVSEASSSTQSSSGLKDKNSGLKQSALPHDCVLRGFKPLDIVHEDLLFPNELPVFDGKIGKLDEFGSEHTIEPSFIGPGQLMQISSRLKLKIDALSPMIQRKTRNIALESILSSRCSTDS